MEFWWLVFGAGVVLGVSHERMMDDVDPLSCGREVGPYVDGEIRRDIELDKDPFRCPNDVLVYGFIVGKSHRAASLS